MWKYQFTFKDGTTGEPMYCTSREEARHRAASWRRADLYGTTRVRSVKITGPNGQQG